MHTLFQFITRARLILVDDLYSTNCSGAPSVVWNSHFILVHPIHTEWLHKYLTGNTRSHIYFLRNQGSKNSWFFCMASSSLNSFSIDLKVFHCVVVKWNRSRYTFTSSSTLKFYCFFIVPNKWKSQRGFSKCLDYISDNFSWVKLAGWYRYLSTTKSDSYKQ